VLVAGGVIAYPLTWYAAPELYDPATGTWSAAGVMSTVPGDRATAVRLPDGRVLVAGGATYGGHSARAELYDPEPCPAPLPTPTPRAVSLLPLVFRPAPTPTRTPTPTPTLTPTVTPTRTRTATPTPTLMPRPWTTVVRQDFEGAFPGEWTLFDESNAGYKWGKRTCKAAAGMYAGWAVGGGRWGDSLGCGNHYADNVETWMIYGPFSLADASAAEVQLDLWCNTESRADVLFLGASVGGGFGGMVWSGNSHGWVHDAFDLSDVYQLGNLVGQPEVWVAVVFASNGSTNLAEGAYVDNIIVHKCVGGGCAASVSHYALASELTVSLEELGSLDLR
jgi:hypothetical protein